MTNFIENERWLVRRATTSGVVPTAPSSAVTSTVLPDKSWADNAILDGELFGNLPDGKLWWKASGATPILIGAQSGLTDFVDLADVPASYAGYAGYYLTVNAGESGVTYTTLPTLFGSFTDLSDTMTGYTGLSGYTLQINAQGTGITAVEAAYTLTGLTDTDNTVSAYTANYMLRGTGSAFELFDAPNTFVTLADAQTINGSKIFTANTEFDGGISIYYPLVLSGNGETTTINNISTDGSFTAVTDNELATTNAIRTFVLNQIFQSASTANFVTTDTNQDIDAKKYFNESVNFYDGVETNALTVTGTTVLSGNTYNKINSVVYYGGETDGSYKTYIDVDSNLVTEKKISGTWTRQGAPYGEWIYFGEYSTNTGGTTAMDVTTIPSGSRIKMEYCNWKTTGTSATELAVILNNQVTKYNNRRRGKGASIVETGNQNNIKIFTTLGATQANQISGDFFVDKDAMAYNAAYNIGYSHSNCVTSEGINTTILMEGARTSFPDLTVTGITVATQFESANYKIYYKPIRS